MQLRDRYEDFVSLGAEVVAIGMGASQRGKAFKEEMGIPFPLLVDRTRESYRLLELARGSWADVTGPRVWASGLRSLAHRNVQRWPKEDPRQLGGAAVILPGARLAFVHRAKTSADNVPVDRLLEAIA
ncbi:MAG: redoxin domain-containing protein [Actinobacteria bacterium]|nr:redoxin domain-containing protein [Actinomycetota bacterium]